MSQEFLDKDFLLQSDTARTLYHEYAQAMPIYDYHCHLPAAQIAQDTQFENISQAWLYGDHYKWRAMRTNGVEEQYCTGDASDEEKFQQWAATVPYCLRNPLYHWTHLELQRYFGIKDLLDSKSATSVYQQCNEKLNTPEYSVRNLMRMMNVKLVCTTDDPLDNLEHHQQLRKDAFDIMVHPAWRPDKAMELKDVDAWNIWVDRLEGVTDSSIIDFPSFSDALWQRHQYFHEHGCRLSDHGLDRPYALDPSVQDPGTVKQTIHRIFNLARKGHQPDPAQQATFKAALMIEFAMMDSQKDWVQQLHIGALRNNSTRMFHELGADTGFDSIADYDVAESLSRFLDSLDRSDRLPKTILYNLNPRDNAVLATMIGNFQDGSVAGKMQFGSGWWFQDQKDGMEQQMNTLSNLGLISRFVGMLTDSRSFLSFPRHEYFRRILCNLFGNDIEKGELPRDIEWVGQIVQDICFNNAKGYFPMECP
jgi:glucuronate isomerase